MSPAIMMMINADDADSLKHAFETGGIHPDVLLANGETLLATASRGRSASVVRFLLQRGAHVLVNAITLKRDKYVDEFIPLPPLLAAATIDDNVEVLELLLEAAESESSDLTTRLASLFAYNRPNGKFEGPSFISTLATTGDSRMMSVALQKCQKSPQLLPLAVKGLDLGDVPLVEAAQFGHADVCRQLIQAGADPKQKNSVGTTAIFAAVASGDVDTVKLLGAAAPSMVNVECAGKTPLEMAVSGDGDVTIVSALIDFNADQTAVDLMQRTALHRAIQTSGVEVVKVLAASAEAQRSCNADGETPLAYAARACSNVDVFNALLDAAPAEVLKMQDAKCYTPLMRAAAYGKVACVKALAKASPRSVHFKCKNGENAVSAALRMGFRQVARLLVFEFGADGDLLRYGDDFRRGNAFLLSN
eukprot:CAMPEP_0169285476 /NCGR_PEP_ID=MMETSP1016-20121227/58722_1 /TAXON_ID=342587 /ORGANISM="Karlodinium micrum, Strain CCMP2283" /LENGTH=418 /DNA_ID=CAMNT_0009374993 /DNA_START=218 /DNA_END=1471 /DNA_ORIENTATION=+